MNCTGDLWSGSGLEALAPDLTASSIRAQTDDLLARLPPRFTLVGLSLGGIVAMALALRAPERVAGIAVMSTNAKAPTAAQREGWRAWEARMDEGASAGELQASILDGLLSEPARRNPALVERVLAMGDAVGERALRAQLRMQATRVDLLDGLGTLTMPSLVVSGEADTVCPPAFHAEIASRLPRARTESVDGGHLLPMERPDAVGGIIADWRAEHAI